MHTSPGELLADEGLGDLAAPIMDAEAMADDVHVPFDGAWEHEVGEEALGDEECHQHEPSANDWELLLTGCPDDPISGVKSSRPDASHVTGIVRPLLASGSWTTPAEERALVAPRSWLQRRQPNHCYQAHFRHTDGRRISKVFTWNVSGANPTPEQQLQSAIDWTWDQYEADVS